MFFHQRKLFFCIILGAIFFVPVLVQAVFTGQQQSFYIQSEYDIENRQTINSFLTVSTRKLYFYVDLDWWGNLDSSKRNTFNSNLYAIAQQFENKDYNQLTHTFGFEDKPGIDNDEHITILLHPMVEEIGGYVRQVDTSLKTQNEYSNQREMIYLDADRVQNVSSNKIQYLLAHEFMHLITFNQKEKIFGVSEEIWLNEARAQYVGTLLGYNDENKDEADLRTRIKDFFTFPNDALTLWSNTKYDYASTDLFIHYLVDHYGLNILVDSLHSEKIGIDSINYALQKNGFEENFSDIFTDWLITNAVNDCSFGEKYCYKNPILKNFIVFPYGYYLPTKGDSFLEVANTTYSWAGNWQKIVGGKDVLKLEFSAFNNGGFKVPYIIIDTSGGKTVEFLYLDSDMKGTIYVPDFGTTNEAIIIIPFVAGEAQNNDVHNFDWKITTVNEIPQGYNNDEAKIQELLRTIEILKEKIVILTKQLADLRSSSTIYCSTFNKDLYFGMRDNSDVKCLQQFLKSKGPGIYPEGLVTGYFGPLTKAAVQRYQLSQSIITTGYFGPLTRAAVNN